MATPNIVPRADSEGGLGTASKYWASAYVDNVFVSKIGRDADNLIDFSVDNNITFRINTNNELTLDSGQLYPVTNDGLALGAPGHSFANLFLANGAVINFDNGNVTLKHTNNKLIFGDSDQLGIGTDADLVIYHDTQDTYITNDTGHLYIENKSNDKDIIFKSDNGSGGTTAYLTLDGSAVKTTVHRPIKFDDNISAEYGTDVDMIMYHSGSNGLIENYNGNFKIIQHQTDKDIIFQTDDGSGGVTAYITLDGSSTITQVHKNFRFDDNVQLQLGGGSDLRLFHDATDSFIKNSHGNLVFRNVKQNKDVLFQADDGQASDDTIATYFFLDGSSAVHDGSATTGLFTNWPDKSNISLGTSHDLRIYHDGSNSYIQNETGNLNLMSRGTDADIKFFCDDGSGGDAEYFALDGGLTETIFYQHSRHMDNVQAKFGSGEDLKIYHDGNNTYFDQGGTGDLYIRQLTDDRDIIFQCDDGSGGVETYFFLDGSSGGGAPFTQFPDGSVISMGTGQDLRIQHDGSNSYIEQTGTGDLYIKQTVDDQHIFFQNDDGFGGTTSYLQLDGANVRTTFLKPGRFLDNVELQVGQSADLKIYHDGTDSYINNATGNLQIKNSADDADIEFVCDDGSGGNATYLFLDGSAGRTVVSKQMRFEDNVDLAFGGGTDLRLYHDPNNSFIVNNTGNLIIENSADDADIVFKCDDGSGGTAEYFRVDGGAKQTRISEEFNFLDSVKATFGAGGDMYLEHDSTNSVIVNTNGNLTISNQADDKDILFKCDNGSGGVTTYITIDGSVTTTKFNKQTLYPDSVEAIFGDGSDLKIKHDGTTSEIRNTEGNLKIRNFADDKDIIFETDDGSGSTTTYLQLDGSEVSTKILTQKVIMSNLPTSDPGNSGQLWNDNGTLKISVG